MPDDPITSDDDLRDLREGAIVTVKGQLESVRYDRARHRNRGRLRAVRDGMPRDLPGIVITFADWSMVHINTVDDDAARSIRIPLREYVTVKARVIDEDMTLEAVAIWTQGGVPIPLVR